MEKIIIIDSFWTDEHDNTWVMDKEGKEHKIGEKRKPEIHELVRNSVGLAVRFTYATFNQWEYIANVELVKDQIDQTKGSVDTSAMEKSAKEGKPYEVKPEAKPTRQGYKADPAKTESIQKQTALIQSCNLAVSGVIDRMQILTWAEFFDGWLNGDIYIPDKTVLELFNKYVVAAAKEV